MTATIFFICGVGALLTAAEKGKSEHNVGMMFVLTVVGMILLGIAFALLEG